MMKLRQKVQDAKTEQKELSKKLAKAEKSLNIAVKDQQASNDALDTRTRKLQSREKQLHARTQELKTVRQELKTVRRQMTDIEKERRELKARVESAIRPRSRESNRRTTNTKRPRRN